MNTTTRQRPQRHRTFTVYRVVASVSAVIVSVGFTLGLSVAAPSGLTDRVIEHKLANGMTILMVERHQAPVVSINMTFGVGGVNEQVGQTGLAHLYEHMAFKGTSTVGTKDYEKEKPILDELHRVGTELEQRQRDMSRRGADMPAEPAEQAAIEELQKRFKELQDQAAQYVAGNEVALLDRKGPDPVCDQLAFQPVAALGGDRIRPHGQSCPPRVLQGTRRRDGGTSVAERRQPHRIAL